MDPEKIKTSASVKRYMLDLPFENDLDQDALNRLLRKPGKPPYDPTARWLDPPKSSIEKPDGASADEE